ncbi:MAG: DUF935 family protein [archaeon]
MTGSSYSGLHNTTVLSPDRVERYRRSRFNAIKGLSPERLVQYMSDWNAGYLRYMAITMEQIMQRDPTFQTVVPKRMSDVSREDWTIQIVEGHENEPEAVAQKDALHHFYSNLRVTSAIDRDVIGGVELAVGQMVRHGVGMKYCCHEILWRQNMSGLTAVLNHVPGWFFEARTGKLRFLMEDFSWDGVPMNTHNPMADAEKMDIASWMVSVGPGIMEAGSVLYLYGMFAMRDWADYSEQRGKPLTKGHTKAPAESERHKAMQALLARLGPNNPILLGPKEEEDVEILQTAAAGPLACQTLNETMEKRKTSLWRGGDLSTTSSGAGQEGQGASLQQGETTNVKEGDLLWASNNFRFQLDPLIIRVTRGPNVPVLAYFTLGGADKSNAALEVQVDTFLVGAGFPISVSSAAARYNRPIPGPEEQLLTAPQPQGQFGGGGEQQPPEDGQGQMPDNGEDQPPQDGSPENPFDSDTSLSDDEGPFGNSGGPLGELLANSRLQTRELVGNAARKLAKLKAKSFKPVADALMDAYNESDMDKMIGKLRVLRTQLPGMLKQINRNPQSAQVFEDTMATALVQGVANEGTVAGAVKGWITRKFGAQDIPTIDGESAGKAAAESVGGTHQHSSAVQIAGHGIMGLHRITHDDPEMASMVLETSLRKNGYTVSRATDKLGAIHLGAMPVILGRGQHHFVLYKPEQAANELRLLAEVERHYASNACYPWANEGTTDGALKGWETRRHGGAMQLSQKAFESGLPEDHEAAAKAHEGVRPGDEKRGYWAAQHRNTARKISEEQNQVKAKADQEAVAAKVQTQTGKADDLSATAHKASDGTIETGKGHSDASQAHRLAGDAHSRIFEDAKRRGDLKMAGEHFTAMREHRAMQESHKFLAGEKGDRPLKQAKADVLAANKAAAASDNSATQFKVAEANFAAAASARTENRPRESKAYAIVANRALAKAKGSKKPSGGGPEAGEGRFKKDDGKKKHARKHVGNEGGQACGDGFISSDKTCHVGQTEQPSDDKEKLGPSEGTGPVDGLQKFVRAGLSNKLGWMLTKPHERIPMRYNGKAFLARRDTGHGVHISIPFKVYPLENGGVNIAFKDFYFSKSGELKEAAGYIHETISAEEASKRGIKVKATANEGDNCGTGAGGFQPGNDCAKGDGASADSGSSSDTAKPKASSGFDRKEWTAKPVPDRIKEWVAMPQSKRDELADATHSIPARKAELLAPMGEAPQSTGDYKKDTAARLAQASDHITRYASGRIGKHMDSYGALLNEAGVDKAASSKLVAHATDELIAQEMEAMRRQLGDHGISHIGGNIDRATKMLEVIPGGHTAQDKLQIVIANVYHDSGYLTNPSRSFLDEGHPRWSAESYNANVRPMIVSALGNRAANEIEHDIRTHDATTIDWREDAIGSAVRVADNTGLFQRDKLPPLFRHAPANIAVLSSLTRKEIDLPEAQRRMMANVTAAKLPQPVKDALGEAVKEVGPMTGKFTLGMMGGNIERVRWENDHVAIDLREDKLLTALHKVGDFGQRQFGKFAETYGADPARFKESLGFEFKDRNGRVLLSSRMVKSAGNESVGLMDLITYFFFDEHFANDGGQACGEGFISGSKTCHAGLMTSVPPNPAKFATSQSEEAHEATRKAWAQNTMDTHFAAVNAHNAAARAREVSGDKTGAKMHTDLAEAHHSAYTKLAMERFLKKKPMANEEDDEDNAALRKQVAGFLGVDESDPDLEEKAQQAYDEMGQDEDPGDDDGSGPGDDGTPSGPEGDGVPQGPDSPEGESDPDSGSDGSGEPAASPNLIAKVDPDGKPPELMDFNEFQASAWSDPAVLGLEVSNTGQLGAQHKSYISVAVTERKPVLKRMADYYGVPMPVGYEPDGDNYVWTRSREETAPEDGPELMDFPTFKESRYADADMLGFEAKGDENLMSAHRSFLEAAFGARGPVNKSAADKYGSMGLKLPLGYRASEDGERYEWGKDATATPPRVWAQESVSRFMAETVHERAENPNAKIVIEADDSGRLRFGLEVPNEDPEWDESKHSRDEKGQFAKSAAFALKLGFEPIRRVGDQPKEVTEKGEKVTKMVGGKWVMAKTGEDLPEHLKDAAIPPAWKNAYANPKPGGKYQAVGMDSKLRIAKTQTPAFVEHQKNIKFARITELKAVKSEVFSQTERDMKSSDKNTSESASCLKVIQSMGIRPGSNNDTKAAKKAYGATTLQGRHVVVGDNGTVRLKFTGKKGVDLSLPVKDPEVAKMLVERAETAGRKGTLFATSAGKLQDYTHTLGGGGFTPKDFRTLKGTETAEEEIGKVARAPKTFDQYKKAVRDIGEKVGKVLGNTPAMALKAYIDPHVFEVWKAATI